MEEQEIELTVKISMSVDMGLSKRQIRKLIKKHLSSLSDSLAEETNVGTVNEITITNLKEESDIYGN